MLLQDLQQRVRPVLVGIPALGLLAGFLARLLGYGGLAPAIWVAATIPVLLVLLAEIVTSLRRGDFGLDVVAALSMTAALIFGEELAAVVVALMYSGGQYLESFAEGRARREMTALLSRVPRTAMRHRDDGLEEIALDAIDAGDRLLIRRGDVVPVDGTVASRVAVLDESALTGEALPVQHRAGEAVMSGSANAGDAFDLTASRRASDSTFAGIIRLVEQAQRSRAPMARLADRYAMGFLVVTVAIASAAWFLTGDPIRAVAVLVVATPCPLILAVPVALVSGLSRAARHGILIKGGKALEVMSGIRAVVLDKTGTLTDGRPRLVSTEVAPGIEPDELLMIAASLEQASHHTIAQTIVAGARARGMTLATPSDVAETPGEGVEGRVQGYHVIVGGLSFVSGKLGISETSLGIAAGTPGSVMVAVAIEGRLAGVLVLADELRAGTETFLARLRTFGVERIVLATGDRQDVAREVTRGLPFDAVRADLTPDQKVTTILSERKNGPVMMIGDGVNDAPALAAADLGVAMGSRGAAASAEAADVVLLVDRLNAVLPGLEIARRSRRIALESVYGGIGLSVLGMIAAAFGHITPVQGALIQEAIDIAVILNALRALQDKPASGHSLSPDQIAGRERHSAAQNANLV
ncbi:heavy metal translocating P-type ATPase [Microvirga massiliensis]|uniref:heavy metal translocating P-type ATPase n=1 Tax=Microvirga massiliensis TaxID=1033741 RepID=UPI00062BDF17|nr:heavy metal translocating P-type ATPase [Microvirga massiliensis]